MSYDISLVDPVSKETLLLDTPHQIKGGTYAVGGTNEAALNITYNYNNYTGNDPATVVYWNDGTKTVVKCQPRDVFSAETGLTTAMLKKYMGNDNTFNRVINEWLKRTDQYHPALPALPAAEPVTEATE